MKKDRKKLFLKISSFSSSECLKYLFSNIEKMCLCLIYRKNITFVKNRPDLEYRRHLEKDKCLIYSTTLTAIKIIFAIVILQRADELTLFKSPILNDRR